jgi:hypothetical protein
MAALNGHFTAKAILQAPATEQRGLLFLTLIPIFEPET